MAEDEGNRALLIPVALASFVTGMDNTIVTVSAPAIGRELELSLTGLEWVASSYILAFASLMLVGGRLSDRFGRRRILQIGLLIFLVASIGAALAPTASVLIAMRAVQGIGGALVLPSVFAVIAADLRGSARHLGSGVLMASIASSIALGPVIGGVITEQWNWRWIFWINLPLVLVTMYLTARTLAPSPPILEILGENVPAGSRREHRLRTSSTARRREAVRGLDLAGLTCVTVALTGVTYVIVQGHEGGYGSASSVVVLLIAVGALVLFARIEATTPTPLVNVSLFRNRVVTGGTLVQTLWGLGINGVVFFTAIFLQDALGFSPTVAGLAYVPLAASLVLGVPVAAFLATRIGAHVTVSIGMGLLALGLLGAMLIDRGAGFVDLMPPLCLMGFASALTTPLNSAIFEAVPENEAGVVSALVSTFREMSGVLGIAFTGAVLQTRQASAQAAGASQTEAFVSGYHTALAAAAVLVTIGGYVAYRTLRLAPLDGDVPAVGAPGVIDVRDRIIDLRDAEPATVGGRLRSR